MKIAFLISTIHDLGGTAGAVVTQANALCARHDVEIISVYRDEAHHFPVDPRVTVTDLVDLRGDKVELSGLDADRAAGLQGRLPTMIEAGSDPTLDALADVALEAALPELDAEVLVTVTPGTLGYATQLAPARTAIVHQEHRSSSQRPNSRRLLLDHARRADVVVMLTEPMARWLAVELGPDAPRVEVVPNALPPAYRPRSPLTEPVILAAGRLATEKQWTHLISAFGMVADRIPEWRVRIFGQGHARFDIMSMSRQLGLWDRVECPGPTADLTSEWARASISALTSRPGEGFPLVIQEAMAAGVPVIAYDMPSGPRDQIDDGVDGLLVTQGSRHGIAAGLLRLAGDPAERRRMGDAAVAKAATWDSATITARWEEIYADAARRRRGAAGRSIGILLHRDAEDVDPERAPKGREGADVTPEQARHETLAAAVSVAAEVSDQWFVVPPHTDDHPTVVLPIANRRPFLQQLKGADLPAYVSVHEPEHKGWPSRRGLPAEVVPSLLRGRTGRLWLEPWPRVGDRTSHLGHGCAVAVEFWEEGPDGDLHSPGQAAYTTAVPRDAETVTTRVHDVEVSTLPLMVEPTAYEFTSPVDVVYTWVDGNDPDWNAARELRLAEAADETMLTRASSGRARFVDRGELRYSMRSVHLLAPWVRRIHLVTAGQVPSWLDTDHPMINLIDHRDLLPADALPTFNSHAIESVVHRIPGLSEHFLYFNDDFFLGRPARPERFFTGAGSTAVFPSSMLIGLPGQDELPYAKAAANNRRLLHEAFGRATVHTLLHAPYAHRVSVLSAVSERFAAEVDATTRSPFRSATDVSMLSSLGQHYGLMDGTAHVAEADVAFVDVTDPLLPRRLKELALREREMFCLGDGHVFARDPQQVAEIVTEFLETYFPIAAPWER
ncbi:MAG TPA: stealth conserved region 3 domain-containing protein [Nocardioides sp.]|nr:stealth conserved region 3 domain-containing protein [Nocardioides sp.]